MKLNLRKLIQIKAKGHTKALVYNEYANCINILDLKNMEQPSERCELDNPYSDWHKGVATKNLAFEFNELVDSW